MFRAPTSQCGLERGACPAQSSFRQVGGLEIPRATHVQGSPRLLRWESNPRGGIGFLPFSWLRASARKPPPACWITWRRAAGCALMKEQPVRGSEDDWRDCRVARGAGVFRAPARLRRNRPALATRRSGAPVRGPRSVRLADIQQLADRRVNLPSLERLGTELTAGAAGATSDELVIPCSTRTT